MFSVCNTATFTHDHVYATDHNEKIYRNDILTLFLLTIMTKNYLNAAGVFSAAFSLIMIMLQANFPPRPSVIDRIKASHE